MKVIFCNISWMKFYSGESNNDEILKFGNFSSENHDKYTFEPVEFAEEPSDYCLGYVHTNDNRRGEIKLEKILDSNAKRRDAMLKDVLVVWCARDNSEDKLSIVGWYKSASISRSKLTIEYEDGEIQVYNIEAKSSECVLLPLKNREKEEWKIQKNAKEYGYSSEFSDNNIWYIENKTEVEKEFLKEIEERIVNYNGKNLMDRKNDFDMMEEEIDLSKEKEEEKPEGILEIAAEEIEVAEEIIEAEEEEIVEGEAEKEIIEAEAEKEIIEAEAEKEIIEAEAEIEIVEKEEKEEIAEKEETEEVVEAEKEEVEEIQEINSLEDEENLLIIDTRDESIIINKRKISFREVLKYEILENISKKIFNKENGEVVEEINIFEIKIVLDNIEEPVEFINLIKEPIRKDSIEYIEIFNKAQKLISKIELILDKRT